MLMYIEVIIIKTLASILVNTVQENRAVTPLLTTADLKLPVLTKNNLESLSNQSHSHAIQLLLEPHQSTSNKIPNLVL
jgi:hypothetical protein